MQLGYNYAGLFAHPEQCSPLLDKHSTALRALQANLAAMKDNSSSLSVTATKWWFCKDQKKRHMGACQRLVHKSENRVSLFQAPSLFVLFWRSSLVYAAQCLSYLGPHPTSCGPGHRSILQHCSVFQMQGWAKPIHPQRGTEGKLSTFSSGTCEHTCSETVTRLRI